jgi:hypothetical protein
MKRRIRTDARVTSDVWCSRWARSAVNACSASPRCFWNLRARTTWSDGGASRDRRIRWQSAVHTMLSTSDRGRNWAVSRGIQYGLPGPDAPVATKSGAMCTLSDRVSHDAGRAMGRLTVFDALEHGTHLPLACGLDRPRHGHLHRAFCVYLLWCQPPQGLLPVVARACRSPRRAFSAFGTAKVAHQSSPAALPAGRALCHFSLHKAAVGGCEQDDGFRSDCRSLSFNRMPPSCRRRGCTAAGSTARPAGPSALAVWMLSFPS